MIDICVGMKLFDMFLSVNFLSKLALALFANVIFLRIVYFLVFGQVRRIGKSLGTNIANVAALISVRTHVNLKRKSKIDLRQIHQTLNIRVIIYDTLDCKTFYPSMQNKHNTRYFQLENKDSPLTLMTVYNF